MKKIQKSNHILTGVTLAAIAFMLTTFASASIGEASTLLLLTLPFLVGAFVLYLFIVATRAKKEAKNYDLLTRLISILIVTSLIICIYTAAVSIWIYPFDELGRNKFVYENIATGAGFGAATLTLLLSTLQKDIFWVTKNKTVKLDEREVKDRQEVFEASYKIGAVLVLVSALYFHSAAKDIPIIISLNQNSVPAHLFWIPFSLVISLFALPLMIAAWKRK